MKYFDELGGIFEGLGNFINRKENIEEIALKRLNICNDCPFKKNNTCSKCGCSINMMTRALTKKECPCGKWKKVTTTSCGRYIIDDGME